VPRPGYTHKAPPGAERNWREGPSGEGFASRHPGEAEVRATVTVIVTGRMSISLY